jgi:hypothetical protein
MTETEHLGTKYKRSINDMHTGTGVTVDVYSVLEAFDVNCPALQHAIKKLLCAGIRGHKTSVDDLKEARDSIIRAIQLEERRSITTGGCSPLSAAPQLTECRHVPMDVQSWIRGVGTK